MQKPFYEKFVKKNSSHQALDKTNQFQTEEKSRNHQPQEKEHYQKTSGRSSDRRNEQYREKRSSTPYTFGKPVFSELTSEAKNILEHFPMLLDQILPLDAKKKQLLPQHIHTLFHELA